MAQTELNRVYVQAVDATGASLNVLSLGTKSLTSKVLIGGVGTSNIVTVEQAGITMAGPTTFPSGLSTVLLTATGNTTLANTSMANLGVTGNASISNASINTLTVVGRSILQNVSTTNLGVTGNASMTTVAINTLSVVGQSTLFNVSSSALTVANNMNVGGNVSINGTGSVGTLTATTMVATNASINGPVNVAGATSVQALTVAGAANFYNDVRVEGSKSLTVTGNTAVTGTLGVTGQTNLGVTWTGALSVAGTMGVTGTTTLAATGTGALTVVGATQLNTTGSASTTIGSGTSATSVGGTLGVTGQTTLQNASLTGALAVIGNCSMNALTATGATTINTTGSASTTIGSSTSATTIGGSMGVTGQTTLQNASVTGNLSVTGNCSMNNVTVTALTSGSVTTSNVSTSSLNATYSYIGTNSAFNYGPTFVNNSINVAVAISENELSVTLSNQSATRYSNTPIPPDLLYIGAKFLVTITARGPAGSFMFLFNQQTHSETFYLTSVMTTYTKVLTITSVTSNTTIFFYGNGTITWSTITIEPYNTLSVNGRMDVSGSLTVSGSATVASLKTSGYTSNLFNYAPTFTKTLVGGTLAITNGVSEFTLSGASGSVVSTVPVIFRANTKYTVILSAFGDAGTSINVINAAAGFTFSLTTMSTAYTKILTMSTGMTSMSLLINGSSTKKVTWSDLTIEPYYDMTIGSNTLSIAGDINVSSGVPFTGWATNRMITSSTAITMDYVASVAYGNETWVMNGFLGTVLTSKNEGATWNSQVFGSTANLFRGCAFGNSIFVLNISETPGKNWTSPDGLIWTLSNGTMPAVAGINWTTFGNGIFVGVSASNTLFRSVNGIDWTSFTLAGQWYGVIYGNGIFVACGNGKIAKSNAAGDSWTAIASPPTGEWRSIAYGNGIYMVSSWETGGGYIATSTDATTWTRVYTFGYPMTGLIYHDNAWFVGNYVSYNNGVTWTDTGAVGIACMASGNGKILGGYQNNQVFLMKRTARTDGTTITSNAITIGGEGTSLNIVSNNLNVTTGAPTVLFTSYTSSSTSISTRYGAYGNGIFVVAEDTNGTSRVLTTTTGLTATFYTPPSTTTLRGLAYGLITGIGTFILSSYDLPSKLWLSTDGQTWTGPTATTLNSIHTIAYGNGVFIVGCLTETSAVNVGVTINGKTFALTRTVLNPTGILKMAFGAMSTGDNVFLGLNTNFLCRSIDNGSSWNTITIPNGQWTYCEFGNDVFIAVGNEAVSNITVSRDGGQTWSPTITFGLKLSNPVYIDNTWCIGSTTGYTLISKDNALTWENRYTGFSTRLFLYGNDKLLSFTQSALTLVNAKSRRSDGTNMTADTITIGREGSTTVISSNAYFGAKVGIGTTDPAYPLHVPGFFFGATPLDNTSRKGVYFNGRFAGNTLAVFSEASGAGNNYISIVAGGCIMTGQDFIGYSDRRIKENIIDVQDESALVAFRQLKPKTYTYKDKVKRGTEPVYGFIAQEVKEVINHASTTIKETVPSIYEFANLSTDIITFTTFNTSDLLCDPSGVLFKKIKFITHEEKEEYANILEVLDEHTLRVDKDLTNWGGLLDVSGNIVLNATGQPIICNQIFVYGQEVNDFHTLNKDAIWTVATAALQEVDRQLQAEKEKTARLETVLEALMARVLALEQKA